MSDATAYFEYVSVENADLFTVVCLPKPHGAFPAVILRSPYVDHCEAMTEAEICQALLTEYQAWLSHGYAVVFQHCRGCGKSSGDFIPYLSEREDGLHLQDWIRRQPFYNGELYLYGLSYLSSVHFVTAPFAPDIKGAVLKIQDCERYNINYRNGFFKIGLAGDWYAKIYKKKTIHSRNYTTACFNMLPLAGFSKAVFGEAAADFDEILKHPHRDDPFWTTRFGGSEAHDAIKNATIPILLITGFYDIYTGGIFDMWKGMEPEAKSRCALVVHPFDHGGTGKNQPIPFPNGDPEQAFKNHSIRWLDAIRGISAFPFEQGKVTYYKLFDEQWCCDAFGAPAHTVDLPLGCGAITYRYDPNDLATFRGGLSTNFGGNAWQDAPNARQDIISLFTPEFAADTFIKGQMNVRLRVRSDCEDTCFYVRLSLCKTAGDYGLRDDITQISNFCADYIPGSEIDLDFTFDEHAFVIRKGEKLRIDISSSAYPHYVRHTNNRGLFSEQASTRIAENTVILDNSSIQLPLGSPEVS